MTPAEAQKALVKAIWSCIVDASSMHVVLSGPEVNAAIRDFKAAIEAEVKARPMSASYCPAAKHHRVRRMRGGSKITGWTDDGPEVEPDTLISDSCSACGWDFTK